MSACVGSAASVHNLLTWPPSVGDNEGSSTAGGDGSDIDPSDSYQFITFYRPTLQIGETFTFEYGYAFRYCKGVIADRWLLLTAHFMWCSSLSFPRSEEAMEDQLIPSLAGVQLLYPTSFLSDNTRLVARYAVSNVRPPVCVRTADSTLLLSLCVACEA